MESGQPHNVRISSRVRLQNLRDFTVQIRNAQNAIVGTGFVVSPDGGIVTCVHVVREAGVDPHPERDQRVGIYFPQFRDPASRVQYAKVIAYFAQHNDDVVLLQLIKNDTVPPVLEYARLGRAELSFGHHFQSYGFRRLPPYSAGWAEGRIIGDVDPPAEKVLQADPVQLRSGEIDRGMSGAPVLDIEKDSEWDEPRNRVIGIISQSYYADPKTLKDHQTAWAVNASVLSLDPFDLPVQDEPVPLRGAPQSPFDLAAAKVIARPDPGVKLFGAPPSSSTWVGRGELLRSLNDDWINPAIYVTGLIGFGGEGKSSLARRWLDTLLQDTSQPQPDGVFWWSFYEQPSAGSFFKAALAHFQRDPSLSERFKKTLQKWDKEAAQTLGALLATGRYLFILDGLEIMQHQEGDQYGLLEDENLREFLCYFATPEHMSFCLITSRTPLFDLIDYTTYKQRNVDHLNDYEGRALLRQLGVSGTDALLSQIVAKCEGYALALTLIGTSIVEKSGGNVVDINDLPVLVEGDPHSQRIDRILRHYDKSLTDAERAFLMILSAFRWSVDEKVFAQVFRPPTTNELDEVHEASDEKVLAQSLRTTTTKELNRIHAALDESGLTQAFRTTTTKELNRVLAALDERGFTKTMTNELNRVLAALDERGFKACINRLLERRIVSYDSQTHLYTTHVLIRAHYYNRLKVLPDAQVRMIHINIAKYYLSRISLIKSTPLNLRRKILGRRSRLKRLALNRLLVVALGLLSTGSVMTVVVGAGAGVVSAGAGYIIYSLLNDDSFHEALYYLGKAIGQKPDTQNLLLK